MLPLCAQMTSFSQWVAELIPLWSELNFAEVRALMSAAVCRQVIFDTNEIEDVKRKRQRPELMDRAVFWFCRKVFAVGWAGSRVVRTGF